MIRVAVLDTAEVPWRSIARRLRGIELSDDVDTSGSGAAVFLAPTCDEARIERLLRSGKHVLVAPEHVDSNEKWARLAEAARAAQVRLAVANPERHRPSRRLIRQQLDLGKFGEPGLVRLHRWERAQTPSASRSSLLRDLDLVMSLFGSSPELAYAVAPKAAPSDGGALMQIHLGFARGGMALLDHAFGPATAHGYQSLSLIGSSGAAYADDHQNSHLLFKQGAAVAVLADEDETTRAVMIEEFVREIREGDAGSATMPAWPDVIAAADAVTQSLKTGRAVASGRGV